MIIIIYYLIVVINYAFIRTHVLPGGKFCLINQLGCDGQDVCLGNQTLWLRLRSGFHLDRHKTG